MVNDIILVLASDQRPGRKLDYINYMNSPTKVESLSFCPKAHEHVSAKACAFSEACGLNTHKRILYINFVT